MELGGEATAIGDDTLALGSMEVTLDATGSMTSAYGSATFVAAAESAEDETAFATADSYGFLSGMDVLVVITSNTQTVQEGSDGSLWAATSETTLYGVDYDSLATDGVVDTDSSSSDEGEEGVSDPPTDDLSDSDADTFDEDGSGIEGNVALLDVDANVSGSDTLLMVEAGVLTIEDTLSTVVGDVFATVG
jgi:hypothetical protein